MEFRSKVERRPVYGFRGDARSRNERPQLRNDEPRLAFGDVKVVIDFMAVPDRLKDDSGLSLMWQPGPGQPTQYTQERLHELSLNPNM